MIHLQQALRAWGTPDFNDALKHELEQLPAEQLPLQQGLAHSSYVSGESFKVMVINATDAGPLLRCKVGVFYTGIIAGCSCADDPSPTDVQPEYCDLQLEIDKATATTAITLLP
ncbi:MAG: hypothetical protein OQL08_12345 [Gammaproteobacteria bacterium]|nr:hypothetical protein [Gammaproteobacteria bacterium]